MHRCRQTSACSHIWTYSRPSNVARSTSEVRPQLGENHLGLLDAFDVFLPEKARVPTASAALLSCKTRGKSRRKLDSSNPRMESIGTGVGRDSRLPQMESLKASKSASHVTRFSSQHFTCAPWKPVHVRSSELRGLRNLLSQ